MDIQLLRNFIKAAEVENISKAAEQLHISQPSLSRQIKSLENELNITLFERSAFSIHLTEEGKLFLYRAKEIIELEDKTIAELSSLKYVNKDIYIACGEAESISVMGNIIKKLNETHPEFVYHFMSGDIDEVMEMLDRGLVDIGFVFNMGNLAKYDVYPLPYYENWVVLMPENDELASKEYICASDLKDKPLALSRQAYKHNEMDIIFGEGSTKKQTHIISNLAFNSIVLSKQGLGYLIGFESVLKGKEGTVIRPLSPSLKAQVSIIVKKDKKLSPATQLLLDKLKDESYI